MAYGRISTHTLVLLAGLAGVSALAADSTDKASAFLEHGDLRSATIELKNALQKDPNDATARLLLARLYLRMGNGAAAEKEVRSAIELGATAPLWRLDFVAALIMQGKYDDALQRLNAATDLPADEQVRALVLRGDAALGLNQLDEARDRYQEALTADPVSELAGAGLVRVTLKRGDLAGASAAADEFLARFPSNTEILLIRAELHRAQGENAQALALFDRVLTAEPQHMVAHLGRATALIGMKKNDEARIELAAAELLQKNVPMTTYLRGVIEFQDKNWQKAAEHLEHLLAAVPGHQQSQLLLGIIRYSEGELETADKYLSNVVKAAPDNLEARKVLAATRIKKREPAGAIEALEPVAAQADPQALALLGSAYMLQGDLVRGQEWLNRAVEAAPDVAALRTQLALTLMADGKTSEAIHELQSAIDLGQDIMQADVLLVMAHLKDKEFAAALEASKRLEERRPESPIPYNLTGLAYLAQGDLENARERFSKALQVDSSFVTAEINLAHIDVEVKDFKAAQRRFEEVLKDNPKHLGALLGLAALAESRNDPETLVATLERAKNDNPTVTQPGLLLTRFYLARGDYQKALAAANDLTTRFPDDELSLQMLARAQTLGGQLPNAIRSFDQLLRKNPNDGQINYLAGGARWQDKDYPGAQAAFRRALELQPDFVDAQVALASVSLDAGDTETAMGSAKALQKSNPDAAAGYRLEGSIYSATRDYKSAAAAFQQSFAREQTSAGARQLADAMSQGGDSPGAILVLQNWVEANPKDLDAHAMLGFLFQQAGRPQDAVAMYETVAAGAPEKSALLLNNLAWLYHQAGDARALATAKDAYDLAPTQPEIADTYGWILFSAGRAAEGLSILQQAYLNFPTQSEIGFHVAAALAAQDRPNEAIPILRKLLRDNPKSSPAADAAALLKKLGG